MDRNVLLVRYETMAANRRHFETLFFGVVAFSWCFGLAFWTAITALKPIALGLTLSATGAIMLSGGWIAYRLLQRERSCLIAMVGIWRNISGEAPVETKPSLRPGAMAVAAAGQSLTGLALVVVGVMGL